MKRLSISALVILAAVTLYLGRVRRWLLSWGATGEELEAAMLGDDLVERPHFVATRAVTIEAPAAEIWPWLVQLGSKRAGWYSYDWIDNAGMPSSRAILPEFQTIEPGQFVPFTPNQAHGMWVKDYRPHEAILWWDRKGHATWLWHLSPLDHQTTRLITRLRTRYDLSLPWVIYYLLYDVGDIVMMRKCMLGIKERAEVHHRAEGRYHQVLRKETDGDVNHRA